MKLTNSQVSVITNEIRSKGLELASIKAKQETKMATFCNLVEKRWNQIKHLAKDNFLEVYPKGGYDRIQSKKSLHEVMANEVRAKHIANVKSASKIQNEVVIAAINCKSVNEIIKTVKPC